MSIFDKWNKRVTQEFLDGVDNAEKNNTGDFPEIPAGRYEVSIEKMEIKESKAGDPMLAVQFKILAGQYAKSYLFFNQVLNLDFQIHIANEFLRSLDTGIDVKFKDYSQYNDLVLDIHEKIQTDGLEFGLKYSKTDKGYPEFKITDVFEN